MPPKNSQKEYCSNCYYHLYNRGVEKRLIFVDEIDYRVFLGYLKEYLLPKSDDDLQEQLSQPGLTSKQKDKILKSVALKNFYGEIQLLAFCLIPNHFHFLLKQSKEKSIDSFLNALGTRYSMYFNKKYRRVGPLFQGVYKAVMVKTDEQLVYLSHYIHRQALKIVSDPCLQGDALEARKRKRKWREKHPSSFTDYLGLTSTSWIQPKEVLSFFSKVSGPEITSYESFVTGYIETSSITKLLIED